MSERWLQYVKGGMDSAGGLIPFALARWAAEAPVIWTIRQALPSGGRVLEVGCGSGAITALLAHHGFDAVGVDDDPDIVACARETVEYLRSSARIEQASAFDLSAYGNNFDLVFSLGVLEHFESDETVRLIKEQVCCARYVLVCVPTQFTKYTGSITDERLYTRNQLRGLVRRAGLKVRRSFVYGNVPTRFGRSLEVALPKALHRGLRHLTSYGMGIACLGERS